MRRFLVLLLAQLLFSSSLFSAELPSGFVYDRVAEELNPTSMVIAPDGRVFYTGKARGCQDCGKR